MIKPSLFSYTFWQHRWLMIGYSHTIIIKFRSQYDVKHCLRMIVWFACSEHRYVLGTICYLRMVFTWINLLSVNTYVEPTLHETSISNIKLVDKIIHCALDISRLLFVKNSWKTTNSSPVRVYCMCCLIVYAMLIIIFLWPLLLTWFNFNPSMDK